MKGLDIRLWAAGVAGAAYALYEFMRFATATDPKTGIQDVWAGVGHLYVGLAAAGENLLSSKVRETRNSWFSRDSDDSPVAPCRCLP